MNENAKAWVEELRSGRHTQTRSYLHKASGGKCCLGVASAMAVEAGIIASPVLLEGVGYQYSDEKGCSTQVLVPAVQRWLGLRDDIGGFDNGNLCLASENDSGKTFAEIADLIEEHQDELFVEDEDDNTD